MTVDMHSFDCVYVINLDHRKDRLASIQEQFKKINLNFTRFPGIKAESGIDGCRLSHIALLKDAKEKGYKNILVCEDDLILRKKLVDDMPKILEASKGCDMLYFHHHNFTIESTEAVAIKHATPWCTHFYAAFNIDKILEWTLKNDIHNRAIDTIYVNSRFNTFVTTEEYAFQIPSQSDITKTWEGIFGRILKYDDLLLEKQLLSNSYKKCYDAKENPIWLLIDRHMGMGDVLLFLSKIIEVSKYYKINKIKLTTKNKKTELMKEVIPMIDEDVTFEWTDNEPTISYEWIDFGDVFKYFKCRPKYRWIKNNSNCVSYQLNGATWRAELKNCSDEDIEYFRVKMKRNVVIDINKIYDFNKKVLFLLNSETYYGIDSGNSHLAVCLGVPTTIVKNEYMDPYLNVFRNCTGRNNVYEIPVQKEDPYNVFNTIYKRGGWNDLGSGPGSDPEKNKEYFEILAKVIKDPYIQNIIDLGCGDYRLMKEFKHNKWYIGVDSSSEIISQNKQKYPRVYFECKNILNEDIPNGQAIIIKDVLQHLPNKDIYKILEKIRKYKYCIITNDYNEINGPDIKVGEWRALNLQAEPFNIRGTVLGNYLGKQIFLVTN